MKHIDSQAYSPILYRYSPTGRAAIKHYKNIWLTDGIVTLRPVRRSDAEAMYQSIRESLAEISPWLHFVHEGYSINETKDFLKRCPDGWKKDTDYVFGILDSRYGSYLGTCGLNRIDTENRRANLGYWIRTSRIGQGLAPAATLLLVKWGFKELKLKRIEIIVATGNQRSQRVAEKVGEVAWLPDSRHLLVVEKTTADSWEKVAASMPDERRKTLLASAEPLRKEVLSYDGDWDDFKPSVAKELTNGELLSLILYLRDHRREGLPEKLEGICGECLMKAKCVGSCIAQNYYSSKNLWAPYWYCEQARKRGLFPETRVTPQTVCYIKRNK